MNKAIEIKNYRFKYAGSDEPILTDCNACIRYGEFTILSGPTGAGKSTLLWSIIGNIPNMIPGETEGDIYVDGESIIGSKIAQISKKIGSVLQNADSQIVHSIVEDEVAFGCENMGIDVDNISKSVDYYCIKMELDKKSETRYLSGGQKQKLITASTLAMNQKILVFDEPLANLDIHSAHKLMTHLKNLCRQGFAVLLIEHRLDLVMPYADKGIWLENGKLREISTFDREHCKNKTKKNNIIGSKKTDKTLISLKKVSCKIGDINILSDIDLDIKEGERIIILGENGCGKTTLLRTLAGLNKKMTGVMQQYIFSKKINPSGSRWFSKVGFVYQNPGYQLFMPSVKEEISYNCPKEVDIDKHINEYDLKGLEYYHPHSLSEGQKRRLSIAAIAANEPKILLLDEPTVGQDHDALMSMIRNLNRMRDKLHTTIVIATHDYKFASEMADQVIIMHEGTVIKTGGKELVKEYFS